MGDGGGVSRLRGTEVDVQFGALEAGNFPAVMVGALETWPAISRWNPENGGLKHLKHLAGDTHIQAITSKSGSVFYGHIKGHDRVSLKFGSFIDLILSESKMEKAVASEMLPQSAAKRSSNEDVHSLEFTKRECATTTDGLADSRKAHEMELYLAQVPIYSKEQEGETMLSPLMQDIELPSVLEGKDVWNINLWMSMKSSRSSTHYDPYHNILCVVAGEKKVSLWPPSAAPYLYPLPIHGEASNHSGVDMVVPNYNMHPLFKKAVQGAKVVTLRAGDALFIPEGWYHQVNNTGVTIAVNFWWPSKISLLLGSPMDGYILRRVISSLLDREKKRILEDGIDLCTDRRGAHVTDSTCHSSKNTIKVIENLAEQHCTQDLKDEGPRRYRNYNVGKQQAKVEDLTDEETFHLRTLVTSALGEMKTSPGADTKSAREQKVGGQSFQIEVDRNEGQANKQQRPVEFQDDPLCRVFANLEALSLQRVLLVMATQFPRSLRVLIMDALSPAAAELLTMKFEELDSYLEVPLQAKFYEQFYSVFESPEAVMAILLERKEAFAAQALQNVLSQFLGLSCGTAGA
ncbi:protein MpHDM8 [Marchantia polymorpha subsp. ruderalis]|uniref:JmjC domain-containing protein n=2 Tax=Marchantia polymorpha TaxID=3197 RepID=A0AAF6BY46_MARPO|nr:hypothetical protein MARPO_0003s0071 [Marchantia polymorpha]BBN16930.1 hypothetical protein Mp_7g10520 [Marchantia polymorpha subsp. ruderalis]|eukprot:PTQ49171.1 hypothetical protein MARPO_0003s0071 [Marchantia polymorpha]